MRLHELKLRWRALIHRRDFNQDVEDELAFHTEMLREHPETAARTGFGNPTRTAETLRELRGWGWIERLWQDLRFALRQLRRNPGFTLGATLPLALAIGCGTAVLTLADAVLFRPMGIRDPQRVAAIYPQSRANGRYLSNSYPDFRDVASLHDQVDSAAAYVRYPTNVRFTTGAEHMNAELVSGDYFRAAGITPALGRALTPADDLPGAPPVALASYTLWEDRFQRSPSILGTTVWMSGVPFTIVGVMPQGYQGMLLDWYTDPAFWAPLQFFPRVLGVASLNGYQDRRDMQMFMILARLKPGASTRQLQAALDVTTARIPGPPGYRLIALLSSQARFFPSYRDATVKFLWLLLAVSIAAVSIACFNLASLLLARAAARNREMSTRVAIGASRGRLVQQLFVEHAVLAALACAASLPLAIGATDWLKSVQFTYIFRPSLNLTVDWRALAIGMAAGMITALAAGVMPALRASRAGRTQSRRASPLKDALVCAQVACAMVVLVSAGVLVNTLHQAREERLGFDSQGVLLASPVGFPPSKTHQLLDEIRAHSAGAAWASYALPTTFRVVLDVTADSNVRQPLPFNWVSDGYFEMLRIPIIGGRTILPTDDLHAPPVAVVNRTAAELLWPGQNPIGRRLRIRQEPADREVVGVAEDIRYHALGQPESPAPCLFLPWFQRAYRGGDVLHVRTAGNPLAFAAALRRIVADVAPDAALMDVGTLEDQAKVGLKPMLVAAQATAAVSLLGVLLAVMGIFASAAYRVRQQRKEIAIRLAIGAAPSRVVRSYAARGLWVGLAGAILGVPAALWGVSLLRSAVVGTGAASLALLLAAGALLSLAALVAATLAASQAAEVAPADVLRVQ